MISMSLGRKSNIKILYLFSEIPGKSLTRKEIQKLTKLANNPLNNSLNFLVRSKILIKEKRAYRLNFENKEVNQIIELLKTEKKNLRNLSLDIWLILFDLTTKLIEKIEIKNIYLFGSYAKLIAHPKSDIDIAIILKKRRVKVDIIIEKIISEIENKFNKKIQIHIFEEREFNKKNKLVKEILKDGIKIV